MKLYIILPNDCLVIMKYFLFILETTVFYIIFVYLMVYN